MVDLINRLAQINGEPATVSRRQVVTIIGGVLPLLGIGITEVFTHNGVVVAAVFVFLLVVGGAMNLLAGNASRK